MSPAGSEDQHVLVAPTPPVSSKNCAAEMLYMSAVPEQ